jgi:hypothetical protein
MKNILDLQVALETPEIIDKLKALKEIIPLANAIGPDITRTQLIPYITGTQLV